MFSKTKALAAATIAALGLASVTATPAQAENGDIARFLAGAAALAIIVDAASNNHHRVEKRYVYQPAPPQFRHRHHDRQREVVIVRPEHRRDFVERRIDRRVERRDHGRLVTREVVTRRVETRVVREAPRRDRRPVEWRPNYYAVPGNIVAGR